MVYDLIIIGGGPAGAAAGVYAARKKIKVLLITKEFGGQSLVSDNIENWIGVKKITGFELAQMLEGHLRAQEDLEVIDGETVSKVEKSGEASGAVKFKVTTESGKIYETKTVLLAAGSRRRKLGVPGEDKFEGRGVAYCSTCLPPTEAIVANSSLRSIAEIERGQPVLTHDGTFRGVAETMTRDYDGELVEIRTRMFSEPVQLTPNHPVLATMITKGNGNAYWRDFSIAPPVWLRADQLTTQHSLLYPRILTHRDVDKISISDFLAVPVKDGMATYNRRSPTSVAVPNKIPVNGAFMRLAGYFIAEGSITSTGINFYFSKKEREFAQDVADMAMQLFQLKAHMKIEGSVLRVHLYSEIIRDLFELLFGKYAHNRKLPHWMVLLPQKKLAELIKGIYRGDGCKRKKDFCIVTNSRGLTYQLRDILLRLGIVPSIQRRSKEKLNKHPGKIGDRIIRFNHDKYHIIIGGSSLKRMGEVVDISHEKVKNRNRICRHFWIDDRYLYLPVRIIKRRLYSGKVHNLVVENNGTYVAKNFIVHNCDAPVFKDKVVAVIGGGNSGLEAVVDLFPYANKIYLIHRGDTLKGDPITQEEVKKNPKVEIILNAETQEIIGDKVVEKLSYKDKKTGETKELEVQGVFIEIGSVPNSEIVKDLVELNEYGEVIVDHKTQATSEKGIWAAGDITDVLYKQNNISAGDAVKAVLNIYDYLKSLSRPAAKTALAQNNSV